MLTLILIVLPLLVSISLFFVRNERWARNLALTTALVEFGISIAALVQYFLYCHCQLLFRFEWLANYGISLKFGMDGLSMLMTLLTTFLVSIIIFSSFTQKVARSSTFYSLIILMQAGLVGVFTAFDGMVFYIFWELTLIPAYFIAAYWGGENRIRITLKFFAYTFSGSLLMLVAIIFLYFRTPLPHSFDHIWLYANNLNPAEQVWIFLAFFIAFAIKVPVFPFHTWQPDTYVTAPYSGSMLLGGLMSKMGLFGMIRWMIPITYPVLNRTDGLFIIFPLVGIVYASLIAIRQDDLKRFVAYTSIAHLGLVAAGAMALNSQAMQGAMIQMVSHGINIVGLFIIIQYIEARTKTTSIRELGGIALKAPRLAVCFMIILLGSVALPLTNGFVGEFLILLGLFKYYWLYEADAGLTIIFSAVYMLRKYQRVMLGNTNTVTESFTDLSFKEMIPLVAILIMVLWIGIAPGMFMQLAENGVGQIIGIIR
ncbi:MAG: NADH-quinone oxidoreductase subunit M [Bacteroidetes bacterium]|nr:NADH-quinone oxidoreductase subunit M [Bacteroidota bacterium]